MVECTTTINLDLFERFDPKKGVCKLKITAKEIYLVDPAGELTDGAYAIWLSKDRTRLAVTTDKDGFAVKTRGKNNATKFISCPVVCRTIAACGVELPAVADLSYDDTHNVWVAILIKGKAGKSTVTT